MDKNTKAIATLILHIEDAASLASNPQPAYIGKTRDGLRSLAPKAPREIGNVCRDAANFIQAILDAKHECKSARFAGYGGECGALFEAEFGAAKPGARLDLAEKLTAASAQLREISGIGSAVIKREWGQEIRIER